MNASFECKIKSKAKRTWVAFSFTFTTQNFKKQIFTKQLLKAFSFNIKLGIMKSKCAAFLKWFSEKENIKNKLLIYLLLVKSKSKNQLDNTLHWIRKWECSYYTLYNNVRYGTYIFTHIWSILICKIWIIAYIQ